MDAEKKRKKQREKIMQGSMFGMMVENAFNKADLDKSGFIEKGELYQVLVQVHKDLKLPEPTEKDVNEKLKQLDTNKDGKISKEEYTALVKELISGKAH